MNHDIKCWPEYFQALRAGEKGFEFRKNDRGYKVGDVLDIEEYDPKPGLVGQYTGQIIHRTVNYVLDLGQFPRIESPILPGYAILGLENPELTALRAENARLRAELEAAKRDLAIVPTICFGGCSGDPSVGVPDCPFFDWVEGDKVGYREAARRCRYAENGGVE